MLISNCLIYKLADIYTSDPLTHIDPGVLTISCRAIIKILIVARVTLVSIFLASNIESPKHFVNGHFNDDNSEADHFVMNFKRRYYWQ